MIKASTLAGFTLLVILIFQPIYAFEIIDPDKEPEKQEITPIKEKDKKEKTETTIRGQLLLTNKVKDVTNYKFALVNQKQKTFKLNFPKNADFEKKKLADFINKQVNLSFKGSFNPKKMIYKLIQVTSIKEIVSKEEKEIINPKDNIEDKAKEITLKGMVTYDTDRQQPQYSITKEDGNRVILRAPGRLKKVANELLPFNNKTVTITLKGKMSSKGDSIQIQKIIRIEGI